MHNISLPSIPLTVVHLPCPFLNLVESAGIAANEMKYMLDMPPEKRVRKKEHSLGQFLRHNRIWPTNW